AIEAAEIGRRHLSVGGLRAVLIEDVEQHEAVGDLLLLLGHVRSPIAKLILLRRLPRLWGVVTHSIPANSFPLRCVLFAPLQLLLLLLLLVAVATSALLVVVGFESHVRSFALFLSCTARFGAGGRRRRSGGLPIRSFLCEAQRAQPLRLLHHRVVLPLLFELQRRFLLLAAAQKRFRIPPGGADTCGKFAHLGSPDRDRRADLGRVRAPLAAGNAFPRRPLDRHERLAAGAAEERSCRLGAGAGRERSGRHPRETVSVLSAWV